MYENYIVYRRNSFMNIRPLFDKVVVEPVKADASLMCSRNVARAFNNTVFPLPFFPVIIRCGVSFCSIGISIPLRWNNSFIFIPLTKQLITHNL